MCGNGLSMSDLPSHIVADILSRLPIKAIIHCRCVCKTWRNLLSDPHFANLHLSRSPTTLLLHQFESFQAGWEEFGGFKLVELEDEPDHHDLHCETLTRFDHRVGFPKNEFWLVGSVNGLLCLWEYNGNDSTRICNPTTREYVILPKHKYLRESYAIVNYGFAFSSMTGQYKVVRIFQGQFPNTTSGQYKSEGEVYTLGTGTWRSLGHVPFSLASRQNGVFLHGSLHWVMCDSESRELIRSFDIEKELFQLVPPPPIVNRDTICISLVVIGDCLCICADVSYTSATDLVIWVMKDYGVKESWTMQFFINKNIAPTWQSYEVLHIIKVLKDGNILLLFRDDYLLIYCPERTTWEQLDICEPSFDVMIYTPSFLMLRNFVTEKVDVL